MIKKQNRLLCLTGILLSCSLALSACQSQPAKEGVQGHKKHQNCQNPKKLKLSNHRRNHETKRFQGLINRPMMALC